jgi:hypothetical protein
MMSADMIVTLDESELSDRSKVYSVVVRNSLDHTERLTLPVVTYNDGWDLAEKLIAAINAHTNERAEWR